MKKTLLVLSVFAVVAFVGCTKKEEAPASPDQATQEQQAPAEQAAPAAE